MRTIINDIFMQLLLLLSPNDADNTITNTFGKANLES